MTEFKGNEPQPAEVQVPQDVLRSPEKLACFGLPVEPAIGRVVTFKVKLGSNIYSYAGIRGGDGLWHTTGYTSYGVSWDVLVNSIRVNLVGQITIMSEYFDLPL